MAKIDQRNEPFLAGLLEPFKIRLLATIGLLAGQGIQVLITRGFASPEEQARLRNIHIAGGPLAAPPGRSWHEYRLAADCLPFIDADHDLVLDQAELTYKTTEPVWQEFVTAAVVCGLKSGKTFRDWPHVEYHPGLTIDQAQRLGPPDLDSLGIWKRLVA